MTSIVVLISHTIFAYKTFVKLTSYYEQMFNYTRRIYFILIQRDDDSYKVRFSYNTKPHLIRPGLYAGLIYMA